MWLGLQPDMQLSHVSHDIHAVSYLFSNDVCLSFLNSFVIEPWHEISSNVVCATSKASDQPAHTRSMIRAFASHLYIL